MPYDLTTPSGFVVTDIPDDIPQEEALRLLREKQPQHFVQPGQQAVPQQPMPQQVAAPASEELPSQEQADNESFWRSVMDVPVQFARGVSLIAKAGVDIFGAGSDASKALADADTYLTGLLSAQAKRDAAEVSRIIDDAKDKGVFDQVVAGLEALTVAPVDLVSQALGTAVPALAAGALTVVTGGSPLLAGTAVGAVGLGTGMGLIKGEVYDAVEAELKKKGVAPEEAAARAEAAQSYAGDNLDLIIAGGGINALAEITGLGKSFIRGRVAAGIKSKLGKEAAERAVSETAREEAEKIAGRTFTGQGARTAVTESLGEGAQGGYEQLAQNIALQREGFDVPTMRGVVSAGVLEAGAGAPLGAGAGALEVRQARQAVRAMEDADVIKANVARIEAEIKERSRLAELESVITGNPLPELDEEGNLKLDEAGNPILGQRTSGRELTEEEQKEYDELRTKLMPTGSVPTTPEEKAAAVEAETNRLMQNGYEEDNARAQALANIEMQIGEEEERKADDATRIATRKQFKQIYDQYRADGFSEYDATMLAVEYMDEQADAAARGEVTPEAEAEGAAPAAETPVKIDTSAVRLSSLSDTELAAFVERRREALRLEYVQTKKAAEENNVPEEESILQLGDVDLKRVRLEYDYNAEMRRREMQLEELSDSEINKFIDDKTEEIDSLEGKLQDDRMTPELETAIAERSAYVAERERRDRERRPVTEKVSKAQRGLFDEGEGKGKGEGESEAGKSSDLSQRLLTSLGPEFAAMYAEARAQIEEEQAARRGRGRPALTEEGSPERAAREKARKQAIAENTRNTRRVAALTERYNKLYREDANRESLLAAALEEGGERGRFAVGKYIDELRRKESKLIAEMMLLHESMPDSVHRRRLGQLLYSVDPQTGRRDKPNPIITPEVFDSSKRAIAEMMEEARQAQASRRVTSIFNKAKRALVQGARRKEQQAATQDGRFNNATTVKDALKIVKRTGTPFMKLVANRIYNAVGDAKFVVVERGDTLPEGFEKDPSSVGLTTFKRNADGKLDVIVYVRGASWGEYSQGINSVIVLHEALHAALDAKVWGIERAKMTGRPVSKKEQDFYNDISMLMIEAKRKFGQMARDDMRNESKDPLLFETVAEIVEGANGEMFKNPQEFIGYAMSEPAFEEFLNSFKPTRSIRSAFGKFVDLVRSLFNFAPNQTTALTELVSAIDAGISTRSSAGIIQALAASLIPASAAKRQFKLRSDVNKILKQGQKEAKKYEESDSATQLNEGILNSVDLRSSAGIVDALQSFYSTADTKVRRNVAKVLTLDLLAEIAGRLGIKSISDGAAIVRKMNSMADNILLGAQETIDNTFRTFQGRPRSMAAFAKLAFTSSLMNIDPATNVSDPQLNKLYAALDEKGKREYKRLRDYFQSIGQLYERLLDDRVTRLSTSQQEKDNILEKIKAMYETGDKIYPFFPLKRFGDYFIRIGSGPNRKFFTFESEFAWNQAIKKFAKAQGQSAKDFMARSDIRVGTKRQELQSALFDGDNANTLREIFNSIDNMTLTDDGSGRTLDEIKAQLKDEIYQTYLATLPDQSIRRQFLHREGITGYSTDLLRSFVEAATQNAFQLSRIKYGPELRRTVTAANNATKNQPALEVLAQEFEGRTNLNLNVHTEGPEQRFLRRAVTALNQTSFIYYLSSVASPMLQMFQLGITGFNTLGANYGFANATAEIGKLAKVWNQYTVYKKNADGSVTMTSPSLARSKAVQMNDRERRAMESLLRHDVVRVTLAAEITQLSKIPLRSLEGSFSDAAKQVAQLPGKMMQATEQLAREMLALTAYRLAYKKHGDHKAAIEEAAYHVADAMGNYAAYNRPPFMRGPLGGLMFQFMMFPVHMTGWFAKNFARSIPFLNKEGKALAFKLWASSLASLWVVAGTAGLPFGLGTMMLGVLSRLFDDMKDDDDAPEEWKDMDFNFYVRKVWLPEQVGHVKINGVPLDQIIDYGPLSAFTGVDFSSRLSMSGMFIRENKTEATLEAEWQNAALDRLGPAFNMITSFAKGLDALRLGDVQKFGEKVAPAALRAPLFAEKYSRQGIVDWEGTVLTPADQVSLGQLLAQAAGFRPLNLTEQGYKTFTQRAVEQTIRNEKNRLYTKLFKARVADNDKEFDRIISKEVADFNKKYPTYGITAKDLLRSLQERFEQRALKQSTGGFRLDKNNAPFVTPLLREDK